MRGLFYQGLGGVICPNDPPKPYPQMLLIAAPIIQTMATIIQPPRIKKSQKLV